MKEKMDIGDVYKNKFQSLEEEPTDPFVWEKIETQREEARFYKFSWKKFNVYYVAAIVIFSLLSLFSFTMTVLSFYNGKENTGDKIILQSDTIVTEQKSASMEGKNKINSTFRNSTVKIDKRQIQNEKLNPDTLSLATQLPKAVPIADTVVPAAIIPVKKNRSRRVVIVEQRDTIIIVDTLHGKKNKKQRNK